jgi:glycosyltransferase involved in cell wall biosynthesis
MVKTIGLILTPIDFGGAEKVSLTLLKNINRSDYNILVIALIRPWEEDNFFLSNIEDEHLNYNKIPVALFKKSEKRELFRVIRCARDLWQIAKAKKIDLFHSNGYFADIIGIPVAKMLGIPIISTCHGFIKNYVKLRIYNALDRTALRYANKIIAVSEEIKASLVKVGIRESIIRVIQNSVETNNDDRTYKINREEIRAIHNIQKNELVIGYVGRLSEEKGLRYLVDAISLLNEASLTVRLLLIGDGPQRLQIESYAEEKLIKKQVVFTGFQSKIDKLLPALDVFVLPSLTEGTPIALLEAMANGLPAIASSVGGIPSIIRSGQNGILTQPRNSKEIAKAICDLYGNEHLRLNLGSEAKRTIRVKFNAVDWVRKIEKEYFKLLN